LAVPSLHGAGLVDVCKLGEPFPDGRTGQLIKHWVASLDFEPAGEEGDGLAVDRDGAVGRAFGAKVAGEAPVQVLQRGGHEMRLSGE
jgi:hypothetical protein